MLAPEADIEARRAVWDEMQMLWMDTDPECVLADVARICARWKYTLDELEAIYWNEVRPAVSFNLAMLPAPEWAGFETRWLSARVLKTQKFGRPLPKKWLHPYAARWWRRLRDDIGVLRRLDAAVSPSSAGRSDHAQDHP